MQTDVRITVLCTLLLVLVVPAVATDSVELSSDVLLDQPGNNATINITAPFNVSQLVAYENAIQFGYSNFSVTPSTSATTSVNLSRYDQTAAVGEFLTNYTATTAPDNTVTFSFTNLTGNELYAVGNASGDGVAYGNASANGTFNFSYDEWTDNPASFNIWRAGTFGRWVNSTVYDLQPRPDTVTLGTSYTGIQMVEYANTRNYTWPNVSTGSAVSLPDGCTQANASQVDVPSGTVNRSVAATCTPGSLSNPVLEVRDKTPTADYTTEAYTTDKLVITSNTTRDTRVKWPIRKQRLERWTDRAPDSVTATVNGSGQNISVTENSTHVAVTIGSNHSASSSLPAGTYTAELAYYYASRDEGGAPPQDDEDVTVAAPRLSGQPVTVHANTTVTTPVRVENPGDNAAVIEVDPAEPRNDGCDYIQLQTSEISTVYGHEATYRVSAGKNITVTALVSMPPAATGIEQVSCRFNASTSGGSTTFTVEAVQQSTPSGDGSIGDRVWNWLFSEDWTTSHELCVDTVSVAAGEQCSAEDMREFPVPSQHGATVATIFLFLCGLFVGGTRLIR